MFGNITSDYMHNSGNMAKSFIIILFLIAILFLGYFSASSYDAQMALTVFSIILIVAHFSFRNLPEARLLWLSLFFKLFATFFYIWLITVYYKARGVSGDSLRYYENGMQIAESFRNFELPEIPFHWGTSAVWYATGTVLTILGPSFYGGSLFFACLSFIGMILFYKACKNAFPNADHKLYFYLIFFFPSIVFWTSQMGKDSLMFFFLGLIAYGSSSLLAKFQLQGLLCLLTGLAATTMIRPHIGAPVAAAVITVFVPLSGGKVFSKLLLLIIVFFSSYIAIRYSISQFGFDSYESVMDYASLRVDQTQLGGSAYESRAGTSPKLIFIGFFNSILRPFPWEAKNIFSFISSMESILSIILIIYFRRNLFNAILSFRQNGYIVFIISCYVFLTFILSTMANFGILARQRVQLLPFFFMLLAYKNKKQSEGN